MSMGKKGQTHKWAQEKNKNRWTGGQQQDEGGIK